MLVLVMVLLVKWSATTAVYHLAFSSLRYGLPTFAQPSQSNYVRDLIPSVWILLPLS